MARGAPVKKEWTVPGPLRALLWWPAAAFVLVMLAPDSIAWSIPASGLLLVTLGLLGPMVKCRLQGVAVAAAAGVEAEPPTMEIEMPTIEMPKIDHRAA
jgi:hypothetical protein